MIDARGPAVPRSRGRRGAVRRAARPGVGPNVELIELDCNVNDDAFADAMVEKLDAFVKGSG